MIESGLLKAVHWVGSGLRDYTRSYQVYKDIWEASTEEQLLCQRENGNRADPFAVKVTLGYSALNETYWARFLLVALLPSTLLCSFPQPSHAGQIEKEDPVDKGQCKQWKRAITKCHRSKFEHVLTARHGVWKISWVENFVTPRWTMKIRKISTPWSYMVLSLVSDVTHQVKHSPTCIIHSPFTGGLKCVLVKMCAIKDMHTQSSRITVSGAEKKVWFRFIPALHESREKKHFDGENLMGKV